MIHGQANVTQLPEIVVIGVDEAVVLHREAPKPGDLGVTNES